jgi:hypothetical protein
MTGVHVSKAETMHHRGMTRRRIAATDLLAQGATDTMRPRRSSASSGSQG